MTRIRRNILHILEDQDISGIITTDLEDMSLQLEFEAYRLNREGFATSSKRMNSIKRKVDRELAERELMFAIMKGQYEEQD